MKINKNKIPFIIAVVCIVVLLLVIAFVSKPRPVTQKETSPQTQNIPQEKEIPLTDARLTKPEHATYNNTTKTVVKTFTVAIDGVGMNPQQIVVRQNEQLQLTLHAIKGPIDIFSKELNTYISPLQQGASHTLILDAPQQGEYTISCKTACIGKDKALGKLVVIEPEKTN